MGRETATSIWDTPKEITAEPVLSQQQLDQLFEIEVDASGYAIGAGLIQRWRRQTISTRLAAELHIDNFPMEQAQTQTQTICAGAINPLTGHMYTNNDVAAFCALQPDHRPTSTAIPWPRLPHPICERSFRETSWIPRRRQRQSVTIGLQHLRRYIGLPRLLLSFVPSITVALYDTI